MTYSKYVQASSVGITGKDIEYLLVADTVDVVDVVGVVVVTTGVAVN